MIRVITMIAVAVTMSACSAHKDIKKGDLCYKNNMYYKKSSGFCGPATIEVKDGGVNITGNFVIIE